MESELRADPPGGRHDRLDQNGDRVASVQPVQDPAGEPVLAPSRSGPPRPGRQRQGANLTLIADLLAKQRCKSAMLRTQDVGNQRLRLCRHPEGAVSAREAQQEPGRVEVALGGETEQTAGPAAAGLSRDDQQGMAEPIDQSAKMWRSSDSALAPISRPLRGSWFSTGRSVEVRAARDGP